MVYIFISFVLHELFLFRMLYVVFCPRPRRNYGLSVSTRLYDAAHYSVQHRSVPYVPNAPKTMKNDLQMVEKQDVEETEHESLISLSQQRLSTRCTPWGCINSCRVPCWTDHPAGRNTTLQSEPCAGFLLFSSMTHV